MDRILAVISFAVLAAFLFILGRGVPHPDLIIILLLTAILVAWDFFSATRRKG